MIILQRVLNTMESNLLNMKQVKCREVMNDRSERQRGNLLDIIQRSVKRKMIP